MKKNKFLALAMAGAMLVGSLITATPVLAEGSNTTTINLKIAEPTYDLVIPSTLDVTASGYTAFADGVTIRNLESGTDVSSIDVTAASTKNDWNLVNSKDNKISYKLVAGDAQTTEKTTYSFTNTTAMTTSTGQNIACGVNVSETDYVYAAAGDYSDTITWTAEVQKKKTALQDLLVAGACVEMEINYNNHTHYSKVVIGKDEDKSEIKNTITEYKADGKDYEIKPAWDSRAAYGNLFYMDINDDVLDEDAGGYVIWINTLSNQYYAADFDDFFNGHNTGRTATLTSFKVDGNKVILTSVTDFKKLDLNLGE